MDDAVGSNISGPLEAQRSPEPASSTVTMMLASEAQMAPGMSLFDEDSDDGESTVGEDLGWMDDLGGTIRSRWQTTTTTKANDLTFGGWTTRRPSDDNHEHR